MVGEANSGAADEWHGINEDGIETKVFGDLGFGFQIAGIALVGGEAWGVEVAGDPGKVAVDLFTAGDAVNTLQGRLAGLPGGAGVVAAEGFDELPQAGVGNICQMGGGMAGVRMGNAIAFEKGDF